MPTAPVSVAVALADKIDTLTGFWAIDEKPTGSKDPFALRRAALGVIRLVLENSVSISLLNLLSDAIFEVQRQEHDQINREEEAHERKVAEYLGVSLSGLNQIRMKTGKVLSATDHPEEFSQKMNEIFGDVKLKDIDLFGADARNLLAFFHDRLKTYLKDQGIRHDIIDACIVMEGADDLTLLVKRARALSETLSTDDGVNLIQGFKRANNILTQAEDKDGVEYSYGADIKHAEAGAETDLFTALDSAEAVITPAMKAEDFGTAMTAMAGLRAPIDAFFTDVQVNADQQVVRRNRLNLLSRIRKICLSVADLTRIEG